MSDCVFIKILNCNKSMVEVTVKHRYNKLLNLFIVRIYTYKLVVFV